MEITDVLKIQNRYLETQLPTDSIKTLKRFNDELIEKIAYETKHPFVFDEKIVRVLVDSGFEFRNNQMGRSRSYEKIFREENCCVYFVNSGEGKDKIMICCYFFHGTNNDRYNSIEIPNIFTFTKESIAILMEEVKGANEKKGLKYQTNLY